MPPPPHFWDGVTAQPGTAGAHGHGHAGSHQEQGLWDGSSGDRACCGAWSPAKQGRWQPRRGAGARPAGRGEQTTRSKEKQELRWGERHQAPSCPPQQGTRGYGVAGAAPGCTVPPPAKPSGQGARCPPYGGFWGVENGGGSGKAREDQLSSGPAAPMGADGSRGKKHLRGTGATICPKAPSPHHPNSKSQRSRSNLALKSLKSRAEGSRHALGSQGPRGGGRGIPALPRWGGRDGTEPHGAGLVSDGCCSVAVPRYPSPEPQGEPGSYAGAGHPWGEG